uniref:Serine/threonine-protein kinase ATR n=1 Tax=Anthurium amnicola TaxID=1678845 RepID=A0A1D1YBN2_9ARAE
MASLPCLIRALRERIAGSASSHGAGGDDPLRTIIPNLLHTYVLPSYTDKEREITAVLKLLSHTAKNFPDVFFQGKAAAVLPVIGRILPFFSEPAFRSRHGVIFEAVASLLSLLRGADREAYRQFFLDAMEAVEDILNVASGGVDESNKPNSARVLLKCFRESFAGIADTPALLGELPACFRPPDGPGVLVDITGKARWQSLAAWTVKLINKCLTEGTRYASGLVRPSFVYATCNLLCYGDEVLHMVCFDFARITAVTVDMDIVPSENLIRSICCILGQKMDIAVFRNTSYDSTMGACFHVLHSTCQDDVVESTASDVINVFSKSILDTESPELKVALCSAYVRIAKICSIHIWKPGILLKLLCAPKPCLPLIVCIKVTIEILGSDFMQEDASSDGSRGQSLEGSEPAGLSVGQKRPPPNIHILKHKRQKTENVTFPSADIHVCAESLYLSTCEPNIESANDMRRLLLSFVDFLRPGDLEPVLVRPEIAIMALSMLSLVFCKYPQSSLLRVISCEVLSWIPWLCNQAKDNDLLKFDVSLYLEAVHCILLLQDSFPWKMNIIEDDCEDDGGNIDIDYLEVADVINLVKLVWTQSFVLSPTHLILKIKCLSLQILSKIRADTQTESYLEILDLALNDKAEEVRVEAVTLFPVMVFCSGGCLLEHCFERLEILVADTENQARRVVPLSIGYLSCLHGVFNQQNGSSCKLYLHNSDERQFQTLDFLLRGFWCSLCSKGVIQKGHHNDKVLSMPKVSFNDVSFDFDIVKIQSLFFQLLFDDSSEECQVATIGIMPRILRHVSRYTLFETRTEWINCIDFLLIHDKRSIREAFSRGISTFLEGHILECLFSDGNKNNKAEQNLLYKLKCAFSASENHQVLETLLLTVAEVMNSVDIHDQLFIDSFILLVDHLDSRHITVQMTALNSIQRFCSIHLKGGFEQFLNKFVHIQNELFEHLCARLLSRTEIVTKFAEAVVRTTTQDFIRRMIPVVIPKLILSQKDNDQALTIMHELAKHLDTDLVPLIVNLLPKVLAFALLRADEEDLSSALQFYLIQTGSDNKEVFSAALPALLDELVCFVNNGDDLDGPDRRVPRMIQEVARILSCSDDLPGFLKNHFVGLLNSIDRKMLHSNDLLMQKQALKRIEELIEMMGPQLSTYLPKIMVLVIHAIEKESLQTEGFAVLHFFIKQLAKVSPSSTKHVISQVVAAFIPCLERYPEQPSFHINKIVEILEELLVENCSTLKQQIRELPLLPNISALSKVNKVIQDAHGSMTLRDQLRDAMDGLNHESLNVRYMVACELSKLLNSRREEITALIAGETFADLDVVSSLISSLLRGCAEESRTAVGQRLKLVCADCLGALGAVDPDKFKGVSCLKGVSCQRFKIECSDDDLIFELIHKHLARAFRAASDTIVQDSAALAIQELLKVAGCQASLDGKVESGSAEISDCINVVHYNDMCNKRGERLWDRFSNYVRDIIAPCLTSRFQLPSVTDSTSAGPIYRSSMSFRRWISFWSRKLTANSTGSRSSIFSACRGIVRHDMQTAIYLLPYLVLNVVCHGAVEARHSITEEILSVLSVAASENSGDAAYGSAMGQSELCIQVVFTLLDNLGQWLDDLKQQVALSQSLRASISKQQLKVKSPVTVPLADADRLLIQCGNVSELLFAIPRVTLARASFRCQAYARALLYFESYVRERSGSFNPAAEQGGIFADEDISFLMEIYSGMDEPDGLSGLASLRKSPSLQGQLLINKKAGNWAEVLTTCEQALQMEPTSVQRHSDVLNCLLNMCHLQSMVTHVDGLISRTPQFKKTWCMQGVQAAWRLGRWDMMDEYLSGADKDGLLCNSSESNASFDMDLAKILQAMMKKDQFMVAERIAQSKQALLVPLAAAGMDSYMRAYPFVVKLHMLCELEDFHALLGDESFLERSFRSDDPKFSKIIKYWDDRLKITQPSLWAREPLLAFRRLVFNASNMGNQVGNCWLQYAKLCRSAGHFETANRAILEAQASGASCVHMEKAKLLWSTRKSDCAIAELQQSLLNLPVEVLGASTVTSLNSLSLILPNPPPLCSAEATSGDQNVAKTVLLYTRWIHYTGQKQKEDVISLYSRVRELQPRWEKGYFFMAKYFDDLLMDARKRQEDNLHIHSGHGSLPSNSSGAAYTLNPVTEEKPWWAYLPDVLLHYAKGLNRGHKNLFQALPRLLTLWFEFGTICHREPLLSNKALKSVHARVMGIMRGCLKDLPAYQWLTVISQLISRICHQNEDVVRVVKLIITSVIQEYPQQALWMMAAVSKSTVAARRDAAAEIIQAARKGSRRGSETNNLFGQFATLIDQLIKLCFHPGQPKARTVNISTEFSALKRMMPLGVIMPVQQALTVTLPTCGTSLADPPQFDVFSDMELTTISGIADEAEILSSLQRPKKVVFIGSDGMHRPFLCKPKDDLRKDARMMEFTAMINRLLSKFPESHRRNLYIRTFAVIPLTEDCGMVEWVPHTHGLRHILQDIYITCGKFDRMKTNPSIKRIYDQCQGKMPEDEMLKSKILPMFPPVFHRWFLTTFSEPVAWFRARVAYAHTAAVWSMVGHIVGLGDRHGENILFDSTTGDCVHVDFSCLFDRGLQLEKPELVPFRLTQNMIDGLGITGYEGVFLKVCEISLSVLRTHKETLMSVLETFIHDPLVEWTKSHKSSGVEVQNPHAQRAISNIKARLEGVVVGVGAAPSLPLAVEGQARRLIAEAVSHKNLGKMYIWWMAWF